MFIFFYLLRFFGLFCQDSRTSSYVEFMGMTRVRSGTTLENYNDLSEKIINDIVSMDASFDVHQLPDMSTGRSKS